MNAISVREKMLYCPKCQREYEDGSQRFCNSDGGRLLPSVDSAKKRPARKTGVFTSLLGRRPSRFDRDESLDPKPGSVPKKQPQEYGPAGKGPVLKAERNLAPNLKLNTEKRVKAPQSGPAKPTPTIGAPVPPPATSPPERGKPLGRLIDPSKIPSGRAPLGDRSINPTGRMAVSTDNPDVLVGQTIKGRYLVTETLDTDEVSIAYVAEDQILKGNKVVVRVLTQLSENGGFQDKIFAEERISLSHVDHPNVAKVIDSGELPEGKLFIVTSELRDNSVARLISEMPELNPMRVARIIRQASYALSEVHQNGILHRNLKPEHILLTISEAGIEQVKVTDFCVSDGKIIGDNYRFRAPEQIGGQLPTFSSDSYALGVIAYLLLTKRYPFEGNSPREVLAAQKSGLAAKPSELNRNLPGDLDPIFAKALAFDPSKRFSKAREFGDILFNVLSETHIADEIGDQPDVAATEFQGDLPRKDVPQDMDLSSGEREEEYSAFIDRQYDNRARSRQDESEEAEISERVSAGENVSASESGGSSESKWKNRSPEIKAEQGLMWPLLPVLGGLLVLAFGVVAVWWYFVNQPAEVVDTNVPVQSNTFGESQGVDSKGSTDRQFAEDIETPPPARQVVAPPNSVYFENSNLNLSDELAKKFLKFSLYYPQSWQRKLYDKEQNKVDDKFLDIAISSKDGIPIKHFSISPYESNGTFKADTELFPKLVEKSNKDASEALRPGSFEVVSQGATTIQNGRWKAYQVNFESKGKLPGGKPLSIWGRRLWIPIQRPGAKTGFIITMLATSLADDVKSPDDVGKKGDLAKILQTFEPVQEF